MPRQRTILIACAIAAPSILIVLVCGGLMVYSIGSIKRERLERQLEPPRLSPTQCKRLTEETVGQLLKFPVDAEWSHTVAESPDGLLVSGTVLAPNAFGVRSPHSYRALWKSHPQGPYLAVLEFDGSVLYTADELVPVAD